jgi:hypothetical protein
VQVLPILDAALALALLDEMATFEEAGIAAARGASSSTGLVPDVQIPDASHRLPERSGWIAGGTADPVSRSASTLAA